MHTHAPSVRAPLIHALWYPRPSRYARARTTGALPGTENSARYVLSEPLTGDDTHAAPCHASGVISAVENVPVAGALAAPAPSHQVTVQL